MSTSTQDRETLRLFEVAQRLGVAKVTHAQLHAQGIPHVHMDGPHEPGNYAAGRRPLVTVKALDRWLERGGDAA